MTYPTRVRVVEVGPRDGLQNEPSTVPPEAKVALIEALADAGLTSIEAGSFVSPKWVPQMAGSAEVLAGIRRCPGVSYPVLVPNEKGLDAALAAEVTEIAVFGAASEAFSEDEYRAMEPGGRAFLKASDYEPSPEVPTDEHPLLLTTGRTVYQFHTRTKTGRAPELRAAAPDAWV